MSILSKATTGKQIRPQVTVVMGPNKVGKTTFAASFPKPIILDLEGGSSNIENVTRLGATDIPTLEVFQDVLKELRATSHQHKTVVVDSAEALEGLISDFIIRDAGSSSLELAYGGFGKGFSRSREIMREIMHTLKALSESKGMDVVIIAHTMVKSFTDPHENIQYDRYIMRCNDKMASIIRDLADNILFATYKVDTKVVDAKKGKVKASGEGERVLYTEWRPAFDAGNRLGLPYELPLDYKVYATAIQGVTPDTIKTQIKELLKQLKDESLKPRVEQSIVDAGDSIENLLKVQEKLRTYVAT